MSELIRSLSPLGVWAFSFGCVIGWSSFVMPGTVFLPTAGPLGTLIAIEFGAFSMLIISYNYAYMMKKFPVSGGEFIYADKAFGKLHGFVCAWFLSLSYLCVIPLNATALNLVMRTVFGNFFEFGIHYKVADYDIYFGEILIFVSVLVLFAWIGSFGVKLTGIIQSILVFILIGGIFLVLLGIIIYCVRGDGLKFDPMFKDDSGQNILTQILAVAVTAPMSYVGFDIVPQLTEESDFSQDHVKSIMDLSILIGCFVYITLTFIACSVHPAGYSNWIEYINDLENLEGILALPTFNAAFIALGKIGVGILTLSAFAAMFTGICGFYTATSRLIYSMSREGTLPKWFGRLNKNEVPVNAVTFCMTFSIISSLFGRQILNWIFDMASIGGAIGFAYTSLATRKFAVMHNEHKMIIWGNLGFIFSMLFLILLLIPVPGLNVSIGLYSYISLIVWSILGILFYNYTSFGKKNIKKAVRGGANFKPVKLFKILEFNGKNKK